MVGIQAWGRADKGLRGGSGGGRRRGLCGCRWGLQNPGGSGRCILGVVPLWSHKTLRGSRAGSGRGLSPLHTTGLCVQADTGSRRHWPESGRLQCLWGDRAGPDTHPRPPHSAAPQIPEDRHSGSLQVWGCRFHGCDRAGTDKHQVPLSSSVHCSLVHTGRGNRWVGPRRWLHAGRAWTHTGAPCPGTCCLGTQGDSGRNRRGRCQRRCLRSGTGKRLLRLGSEPPSGRRIAEGCREAQSIPGGTGIGRRALSGGSGNCVDRASGHRSPSASGSCLLCSRVGRGSGDPEGRLGRWPCSCRGCLRSWDGPFPHSVGPGSLGRRGRRGRRACSHRCPH